jgi:predicted N-acetyltransferase YhbS
MAMARPCTTEPGDRPPVVVRQETPADHRRVEELTREAFWGMSGPGCDEHLLVHRLRRSPALVPELDLVAEVDGVVVGHVVYTRARVVGAARTWEVLTFGPLSVDPACQATGIGAALMRRTLADAARLGHRAVVVYGHPDYYPRFGFVRAREVGITAPGGATFDALMALALVEGGLDGVQGEFHEDEAFRLDPADVAEFDRAFPPRAPAVPTPVAVLAGRAPADVLDALPRHGVAHLEQLHRFSSAEVARWDGVGTAGADALHRALRDRGVRWGAPPAR